MSKARLSILLTGLLALLAAVLAGCGGSEGSKASKSGENSVTAGKKGGSVTYLSTVDMGHVDPGKSNIRFDNVVQYAVHRPLTSFLPNSIKAVPDLAKSIKINQKGDQITVELKRGVKFSPPVNREVTSHDVSYAIRRGFSKTVASNFVLNYYSSIKGAPTTPGKLPKSLPGLLTPNKHTLIIKLKTPTAATMAQALSLMVTAPVPEEYASKFDRFAISKYDKYVVFTGPYMIKNDKTGRLVGHVPGRSITLVRNPNWNPKTDKIHPAYLNKITISEGNQDTMIAARRALEGKSLICCDEIPPVAMLKEAVTKKKSQFAKVPVGTRWAFLNTTVKPFNNLNLRKAILAAVNRDAVRLSRGGKELGDVAQHYIRPKMPAFKESGGIKGFRDLDFTQTPAGDIDKDGKIGPVVKKYLDAARKDGLPISPEGKYTGKDNLIAVGANTPVDMQVAQSIQAQLAKLGFQLKLRSLAKPTMYNKVMNGSNHIAVGPNVGWIPDFADPEAMLNIFKGPIKRGSLTFNFSQLNNPKINVAMKKAALIPPGSKRNNAWAKVNKMVVAQVPAIPYLWDDNYQLWSSNVKGVMSSYTSMIDLTHTSIKP